MSTSEALAIRCELAHRLQKLHPEDRQTIISINRKIAAIDYHFKSMPR
jgi:hypothetical protein